MTARPEDLKVSCRLRNHEYHPEIKIEDNFWLLSGGLHGTDGVELSIGEFRIPLRVTGVELRAQPPEGGYYLVEHPSAGWIEAEGTDPSRQVPVG